MDIKTETIGTYIGKPKLGFKKNHIYKIQILEDKKRGYAISSSYDLSDDSNCNLFCPYSNELMLRREWLLHG